MPMLSQRSNPSQPVFYRSGRLGALMCVIVLAASGMVGSVRGVGYLDNAALAWKLKEFARKHPIVRLAPACQSSGKNDVWRLEIGAGSEGERTNRPALLVVAGIEGNDLAGTAIVEAWGEGLVQAYEHKENPPYQLLASTTLYVWPRVNPDGAHHFFAKPRWETATNDD